MVNKKIKEGVLYQTTKKLRPLNFGGPIAKVAENAHNIKAIANAADVPTKRVLFGQRMAKVSRQTTKGRIEKIPSIFGTAQTSYRKTKKKATFKKAQAPYRKAKKKAVSKV
jgi:hypothetical protein